jgi:hypothetical protein
MSATSCEENSAGFQTNKIDALIAAHQASRENGLGYAFACQWSLNRWTVEARKPGMRPSIYGRPAEVVECRDGREFFA